MFVAIPSYPSHKHRGKDIVAMEKLVSQLQANLADDASPTYAVFVPLFSTEVPVLPFSERLQPFWKLVAGLPKKLQEGR